MTPPSGHTIVTELTLEMEQRLYPLLYRTLPPSVYHVYLHPDDFRVVEGIVPLIVAEAGQALSARIAALNRRFRWSKLVSGRRPPIEAPAAGWEIVIHADANGELEPGQLGIESRLSVPSSPRYESGTPTTRIAKTVVTGALRRSEAPVQSETRAEPTPSRNGPAIASSQSSSTPSPDATATATGRPVAVHSSRTAQLAYVDNEGPHVFFMPKDLISIGRGGSAHWVDVQVIASPRVSREHCRIRRTPDGRFLLQDVSSWGTSVDGSPVAPFVRQSAGHVEETGHEHELPPRARIQLADAVIIEFSVEE